MYIKGRKKSMNNRKNWKIVHLRIKWIKSVKNQPKESVLMINWSKWRKHEKRTSCFTLLTTMRWISKQKPKENLHFYTLYTLKDHLFHYLSWFANIAFKRYFARKNNRKSKIMFQCIVWKKCERWYFSVDLSKNSNKKEWEWGKSVKNRNIQKKSCSFI